MNNSINKILITLNLIFILGCSENSITRFEPPINKLVMSLHIEPKTIHYGEGITIEFKIDNLTSDTVYFDFSGSAKLGYTIETPRGQIISYPWYIGTKPSELILPPNESKLFTAYFSTIEVINNLWPRDLKYLSFGIHKINAGLLGYENIYPWKKSAFIIER